MKFYDRTQELVELNKLLKQIKSSARMTVLTGRRRVGKTSLSLEFVKGQKYLYFFVGKKSENLSCDDIYKKLRNYFLTCRLLEKSVY